MKTLAIMAALLCSGSALAQGALSDVDDRPEAFGNSAANDALEGEITAELDRAVERGLAYLAERQAEDGSFEGGRFGKNVAITSLACLAFMADGHLPGRGEYGEMIDRGVRFVVDNVAENGLIASDAAHGPMYGHGFATLFLGEVYGMTQGGADTQLAARTHEALVKAIRLIERTQNDEGGWRYNPVPYDADVSVTICEIMALRSARNAGLEVDAAVIDKAVEYVRRCQNRDGGFRYQADGGSSAWPRSAAGVASLYYAGIYDDVAIDRGLDYLERAAFPGRGNRTRAHYFYGHYYAVQAMFLAGGDNWARWWPAVREELLQSQLEDGSWDDPTVGREYGTAMALIVLQMPKRYLPIFQK
ncbi:MAG: prenyltransferase/squalene oxidase repeat-containing protein [Planctomycetota bacterium]